MLPSPSEAYSNVNDEQQEILARRVLEEIATVGTGADVPLDEYMYVQRAGTSTCTMFVPVFLRKGDKKI